MFSKSSNLKDSLAFVVYLWSFTAQLSLSKLGENRGSSSLWQQHKTLLIISDEQASSCHHGSALAQVGH